MKTSFTSYGSLLRELTFTSSRSSGSGGQNVNKVNSKVTVKWDVVNSTSFSEKQKAILLEKFKKRLTTEGLLILTEQGSRSQLYNKEAILEKLNRLINIALTPPKPRKKTKPTKASAKRRLEKKKQQSEKKILRKKI